MREIEFELLLDCAAQRRSRQGDDKARKGRAAVQALDREAAVPGDMREAGENRAQFVAAYKFLDDDKIERVAA